MCEGVTVCAHDCVHYWQDERSRAWLPSSNHIWIIANLFTLWGWSMCMNRRLGVLLVLSNIQFTIYVSSNWPLICSYVYFINKIIIIIIININIVVLIKIIDVSLAQLYCTNTFINHYLVVSEYCTIWWSVLLQTAVFIPYLKLCFTVYDIL